MDFTLKVYKELLQSIKAAGYEFQTFEQFMTDPQQRCVILRNDVDRRPARALVLAEIQAGLGIRATYYFRAVRSSWNEEIIGRIAQYGHEIGYHYEDLVVARGDQERAVKLFEMNLARLRKFYKVRTICMHGSPLSRWDNRDLWKRHDYKKYEIIGEPYLDLDFNTVLYLTDTGRCWDNRISNKRDRVSSNFNFKFINTSNIIEALKQNRMPDKIMLNIHPQRWTDNFVAGVSEYVLQNTKNAVKTILNKL